MDPQYLKNQKLHESGKEKNDGQLEVKERSASKKSQQILSPKQNFNSSGSKPKTHSFGGSDQAFCCAPDKFNTGKLKKEKISTTLKIREELRTNSLSQNSRLVTEEE